MKLSSMYGIVAAASTVAIVLSAYMVPNLLITASLITVSLIAFTISLMALMRK